MSLRSMTGHGSARCSVKGVKVEVQLSSVNRKQLDIRLNIPRLFLGCEPRVHSVIKEHLQRGAVTGQVRVDWSPSREAGHVKMNDHMVNATIAEFRRIAQKHKLDGDVRLSDLLTLPGLIESDPDGSEIEDVLPLILDATSKATEALLRMRIREGRVLEKDLRMRIKTIESLVSTMRKRAPNVKEKYRETLKLRIARSELTDELREEFVAREVAWFAEKSDITEELTRLKSHMQECRAALKREESAGRAFEFVLQEIGRELNTIGSKCNDSDLSKDVVAAKLELDRLREQVQNIE